MKQFITTYTLFLLVSICFAAPPKDAKSHDKLTQMPSDALMDHGRVFFEKRQAAQALECFNMIAERQQEGTIEEAKWRVRALNNCACVYKYFYFDYIQAHEYLMRAYELCDSIHDEDFMPIIMVNLGDLINDSGNDSKSDALTNQAQNIFEQCIEKAVETKNWELMVTAFFNLSNLNYKLPLEKFGKIFSSEIPEDTPDLQFVRLQYKGLQSLQQQNYDSARQYFNQQLAAISTPWEPKRDSVAAYMNIAYTYRMEQDHGNETEYLKKALQLASDNNINDQATNIGHLLIAAQAKELTERQHAQQIVIIAIGLALVFVIIFAILLWQKNQQLQNRNRSLFEKNRQMLEMEREEQALRKEVVENKYSRSNLSDEQKETLVFRIQEILSNPKNICQPEFTLAKLAKQANSNTTYVSQVINERYGQAFSNVLSSFRIKEACRRMSDESDKFGNMTIEGVATSVGFKSRTAFINAFKREVGLTPSEYLRMSLSKES
jgi:AraC-like DNA-binding protein